MEGVVIQINDGVMINVDVYVKNVIHLLHVTVKMENI